MRISSEAEQLVSPIEVGELQNNIPALTPKKTKPAAKRKQ